MNKFLPEIAGLEDSAAHRFRMSAASIELLEDRTLMSMSPAMVMDTHPQEAPANVYVMSLRADDGAQHLTAPVTQESATAKARPTVRVFVRESEESGVIVGKYSDAVTYRATNSQLSVNTHELVEELDTWSNTGLPPAKEMTYAPPAGKGTVLLIEDDLTSRVALTTLLKRRGWNVTSATTVADGLRQLTSQPEVVIVDLMLPDGDGERVVQEIRESQLAAKVTVMTGVSDPERLSRLNNEMHPESILSKPVNVAELLRSMGPAN